MELGKLSRGVRVAKSLPPMGGLPSKLGGTSRIARAPKPTNFDPTMPTMPTMKPNQKQPVRKKRVTPQVGVPAANYGPAKAKMTQGQAMARGIERAMEKFRK